MTRTAIAYLTLALGLALAVVAAIAFGAVALPLAGVLDALAGRGDAVTTTIVRDLRLPRVLAAALVGGALAASGALLQGLLRNPLADPYVTGASAGGALGAVGALALAGAAAPTLVPVAAFAGALAAVALVWRIARLGGPTTILTVLLGGIVLTSFAGAIVTLIIVASDRLSLRLRALLDVLVGGVAVRDPGELAAAAAIVAIGLAGALALAPRVDAYAFGEETAATLGVDTERTTLAVLVVTALLTGAAVALAGLVAFVGLVVPHAVRGLLGARHRPLIGASFLAGAAVLVLADLGARIALAPAELPVGVITGAVGGPFFLALLARTRRVAR
ncbi:MAG TPA: iron ABC transporter permease [Candidatus Limnocylindria bacterium]|nr:iron ABC transporter permease [Candidatus Limnocylindria bacterium]